jgi:hypothetical protein
MQMRCHHREAFLPRLPLHVSNDAYFVLIDVIETFLASVDVSCGYTRYVSSFWRMLRRKLYVTRRHGFS